MKDDGKKPEQSGEKSIDQSQPVTGSAAASDSHLLSVHGFYKTSIETKRDKDGKVIKEKQTTEVSAGVDIPKPEGVKPTVVDWVVANCSIM